MIKAYIYDKLSTTDSTGFCGREKPNILNVCEEQIFSNSIRIFFKMNEPELSELRSCY